MIKDLLLTFIMERWQSDDKFVDAYTKRPPVIAGVALTGSNDLRRNVVWGTQGGSSTIFAQP